MDVAGQHEPRAQPFGGVEALACRHAQQAVHREIRGSALLWTVFDFLAEAIPRELAAG